MSDPKTMVYKGFWLAMKPDSVVHAYRNMSFWLEELPAYVAENFERVKTLIDEAEDTGTFPEDAVVKEFEEVLPAYPDFIMKKVRQQLGADENSTSKDARINEMSHNEVFDLVLKWEGIIGYDVLIVHWVEAIYGVTLA